MGKKNGVKFKDTAIFKTIKNIAPDVLDTVTDIAATVYPPLGVVNGLVDKALEVAKNKGNKNAVVQLSAASTGYNEEYKDYLADIQNARAMYKETDHEMADDIAGKIINWNLVIIMALVGVQVYVIISVDGQVAAVITGVVGTVVGSLINERNTVVNFFFGSSKGSKDKD